MSTLEALPIIANEEVFNACKKTGACGQCGVCCTMYEVENIPSVPKDINSAPIFKRRGDPCPQLRQETQGKFFCLLHDHKDDPRLKVCQQWMGNDLLPDGNDRFHHMCESAAKCIQWPESRERITDMVKRLEEKSIPAEAIALAQKYACQNPVGILSHFARLGTFPRVIMETLQMPDNLKRLKKNTTKLLGMIGVKDGTALAEEFFAVCIPFYDDDAFNYDRQGDRSKSHRRNAGRSRHLTDRR